MNSNNRIAATLFPRDIVCLRNISKNTLHKGDDDDNNNNNMVYIYYIYLFILMKKTVILKNCRIVRKFLAYYWYY